MVAVDLVSKSDLKRPYKLSKFCHASFTFVRGSFNLLVWLPTMQSRSKLLQVAPLHFCSSSPLKLAL